MSPFSLYMLTSWLAGLATLGYAAAQAKMELFPAILYLGESKLANFVLLNLMASCYASVGMVCVRFFLGWPTSAMMEQLTDSARAFIADTIMFVIFYGPTVDGADVKLHVLVRFVLTSAVARSLHLLASCNVSHAFESLQRTPLRQARLLALLVLLVYLDAWTAHYYYSIASPTSTFYTWIFFEFSRLSVSVVFCLAKFGINAVDSMKLSGLPFKNGYTFYVDILNDFVQMSFYIGFVATLFVRNPRKPPLYIIADALQVTRQFVLKVKGFRRYLQIIGRVREGLPDATEEEIAAAEQCIICRDALQPGCKKLGCGHVFHLECLKSWLLVQQNCPTCRADVKPMDRAAGPSSSSSPAPSSAEGSRDHSQAESQNQSQAQSQNESQAESRELSRHPSGARDNSAAMVFEDPNASRSAASTQSVERPHGESVHPDGSHVQSDEPRTRRESSPLSEKQSHAEPHPRESTSSSGSAKPLSDEEIRALIEAYETKLATWLSILDVCRADSTMSGLLRPVRAEPAQGAASIGEAAALNENQQEGRSLIFGTRSTWGPVSDLERMRELRRRRFEQENSQ